MSNPFEGLTDDEVAIVASGKLPARDADLYRQYGQATDETTRQNILSQMSTPALMIIGNNPKAVASSVPKKEGPTTSSYADIAQDVIRDAPGRYLGPAADFTARTFFNPLLPMDIGTKAKEQLSQFLGVKGYQPQSSGQSVFKATMEEMTNPANITGIGTAVAGGRALFGPIVSNLFGAGLAGGGAESGRQIAEGSGAQEGGQTVGSLLGGVTGAVIGGVAGGRVGSIPAARRLSAALGSTFAGTNAMVAAGKLADINANGQVRYVLEEAMKLDPQMGQKIQKALSDAQATGVELPLSAILENSVINSSLASLAAKHPGFQGVYSNQWKKAQEQLLAARNRQFGDPQQAARTIDSFQSPIDTNAQKAVEDFYSAAKPLDDAIANLSKVSERDPSVIGQRIRDILAKKEAEAREKAQPFYDDAFAAAGSSTVSGDIVADLVEAVKLAKREDIFNTLAVENKVTRFWKPKKGEKGEDIWEAIPIEQLDSLKRAINKAWRSADGDERTKLYDLKQLVYQAADRVNPEFGKKYRLADETYAQMVGVPYRSYTINAMDRTAYETKLLPKLTATKESLQEFMLAAGPQGTKIAEDALAYQLWKSNVFTGGLFNPRAAKEWYRKNEHLVNELPEFKQRFFGEGGVLEKTEALYAVKEQLENQFTENAKSRLADLSKMQPQQLVNKIFNDKEFMIRMISPGSVKGMDDDVKMDAIRSYVLNDIFKNGDPRARLQDPATITIFGRLFGPAHINNISRLADIASRLDKNHADVSSIVTKKQQDAISKATGGGISGPQILTLLRDRITSLPQKVGIVTSRVQAALTEKKFDEALIKLYSDPVETRKFLDTMQKIMSRETLDTSDLQRIIEVLSVNTKSGIGAGMKATISQTGQQ